MSKFTPGPWVIGDWLHINGMYGRVCSIAGSGGEPRANARLIAAAPDLHSEMARFLPVIERAEADPKLWAQLTEGAGIATANGYRAAIAKAAGESA